jgi:hypothetical protein
VSGRLRTPSSAGFPLHVFNGSGGFVRSFGATEPTWDLADPASEVRILGLTNSRGVWAVTPTKLFVEQFDVAGRLTTVMGNLSDSASPAAVNAVEGSWPAFSPTAISQVDPTHIMLTAAVRGDIDPHASSDIQHGILELQKELDGLVLVIDLSKRAVIGRLSHESPIAGIIDSGHVYYWDLTVDERPMFRILDLNRSARQ